MKFTEEKRDLFSVDPNEYTYVHCIASDLGMGAGIAVPIRRMFHLKNLRDIYPEGAPYPDCIYYYDMESKAGVFNLVTKQFSWGKPTYEDLKQALLYLKDQCCSTNHVPKLKLAMPKIGCGLDRLEWSKVKEMIEYIFSDTDVEILVCYL